MKLGSWDLESLKYRLNWEKWDTDAAVILPCLADQGNGETKKNNMKQKSSSKLVNDDNIFQVKYSRLCDWVCCID